MEATRQRITEAAVRLHTSVGPANTSVAAVAAEAGVTRLTVYRHFADLDSLYVACMGHWNAAHPGPDTRTWSAVESLPDRASIAFEQLYRWYDDVHEELFPIYRDEAAMPDSARAAMVAQREAMADAVLGTSDGAAAANETRVDLVVARHLVDFWTWRSLVLEHGLGWEEAARVAVRMLLATRA